MRRIELVMQTNAGSAGTVTTSYPVSGYVAEVRCPSAGTAVSPSTADWTITRAEDGGTILAVSNQVAPWTYQPRVATATTAGVAGTVIGRIPVNGYVTTVVAQSGASVAGTIHLYIEDC